MAAVREEMNLLANLDGSSGGGEDLSVGNWPLWAFGASGQFCRPVGFRPSNNVGSCQCHHVHSPVQVT